MLKNNRIGVLCQYPFPEGMAATVRILAYCKGLLANGVDASVFSFEWLSDKDPQPMCGEADGVRFKISHKWKSGRGKLAKILVEKPKIYLNAIRDIDRENRRKPLDYIFVSTDSLSKLYFFAPILRFKGYRLVFISDEFPLAIRRLNDRIPRVQKLLYRFIFRFFDKRVLMTEALKDFYDDILPLPTHLMCSILNKSRFDFVKEGRPDERYICYMGNMQLTKDNVDNIIRAFALTADRHPDVSLRLYGTPSSSDRKVLEEVVSQCGLQTRVVFCGRAAYGDVPQILADAELLVTSQPSTVRAQGGFPTKMAEYMMSRTPMIVTDVGEIGRYVKDGETTFMVKPCDPAAYADKISYVLDNPREAALVAGRAYEYAVENFDSANVTRRLAEFLRS